MLYTVEATRNGTIRTERFEANDDGEAMLSGIAVIMDKAANGDATWRLGRIVLSDANGNIVAEMDSKG